MVQILKSFQEIASVYEPLVLIIMGLICVVIGLFVWLGGLGFRNVLAGALGATVGGVCGYAVTTQNLGLTVFAAALSGFFAVVFERIFITVLTVVLAIIVGFVVVAELHGADFSAGFDKSCLAVPIYGWLIIAALASGAILGAFYLWRFASALCCASLGTMLVFAGMILLLISKDSAPVAIIASRTTFYTLVCVGMVAFGTVEQLILCPRTHQEQITARRKKRQKQDSGSGEPVPQSWRTS